jgi:hypothetical protein
MPNVTVPGSITSDNAEDVLHRELGSRFTVEPHGDTPDKLKVKLSALTYANVRVDKHESDTTFHVHGGGFLIGRAINEFGIARQVATALKNGYAQ